MRYTLGRIATAAMGTVLAVTGATATGIAQAQPARPAQPTSLYAPSVLVLTISRGDTAATATVERAVTLSCTPRPSGTHPSPTAACTELRSVEGEFNQLTTSSPQRNCTRQWDPVVITASGAWQGRNVSWSTSFGNPCEMQGSLAEGAVFTF
ncbi:protease inhibitor protein [Streptomyces finlayi]|uniref:Probable subtilase-type protease inhibitor n=1 Tax=Streptomyces finlayi TaxID=67296 RepID=A0A7G7BK35_9ACTN|nr:subtilase-type protease inhibitor [Streptomyces finlayi]QNE75700.1 protease inhibitor protein [Streptomyces finlayi]